VARQNHFFKGWLAMFTLGKKSLCFSVSVFYSLIAYSVEARIKEIDEGLLDYRLGYHESAIRRLTPYANKKNPDVMFWVASLHHRGKGTKKNLHRAADLYSKAAYLGNTDAQNNLALLYRDGFGVKKDTVKAHAWFSIAAMSNNRIAEDNKSQLSANMRDSEISASKNLAQKEIDRIAITITANDTVEKLEPVRSSPVQMVSYVRQIKPLEVPADVSNKQENDNVGVVQTIKQPIVPTKVAPTTKEETPSVTQVQKMEPLALRTNPIESLANSLINLFSASKSVEVVKPASIKKSGNVAPTTKKAHSSPDQLVVNEQEKPLQIAALTTHSAQLPSVLAQQTESVSSIEKVQIESQPIVVHQVEMPSIEVVFDGKAAQIDPAPSPEQSAQKELEKRVDVSEMAKAPKSNSVNKYVVQLGIFKNKAGIANLQKKAERKGLLLVKNQIDIQGKPYTRIRHGQFKTLTEAKQMSMLVDQMFNLKSMITSQIK
jgi:hypothetical protein